MSKPNKGFTLVELVIVMAIISVLAALIVGAVVLARQSQRNTSRTSDAKTFQVAVESYFASVKSYPGTVSTAYKVYDVTSTLRQAGGPLVNHLTTFPTSDPNGSANRVIYCPLSKSTFNLYVVTEPTADPGAATCAVPAGSVDLSVK